MSKHIDTEKFATALLSSYNFQTLDIDKYVEKGLELYLKALDKAEEQNKINKENDSNDFFMDRVDF
ncbi:hypothetical protein ACUW9N_000902 [Staphylococcus auricularis]|uniref:hypothetical protein n=1 Tax=Staphylococcus auricularis TaxID=29379 RepID=UPI0012447E81|nr:hypothetical protein [Staphylococcus auricularis]MBM0868874.1 hypothetical protein [Staphylococcus auricularis]BCU51783.1 hypothetical protein JCM2421_05550 [Staphylococcus auricularis]